MIGFWQKKIPILNLKVYVCMQLSSGSTESTFLWFSVLFSVLCNFFFGKTIPQFRHKYVYFSVLSYLCIRGNEGNTLLSDNVIE